MSTATITIWFSDRELCPRHSDGWHYEFCGCVDWRATLLIKPADEEFVWDIDAADYYTCDSSRRVVMQSVRDEAWLRGCRRVRICDEYDCTRDVVLRSSERRAILLADRLNEEAIERIKQHAWNIKNANYRALIRRVAESPRPQDVLDFFNAWKEVTGYGPKDTQLRDLLAPGKETLIKWVLEMAAKHNWPAGRKLDDSSDLRTGRYSTSILH